MTAGEIVNRAAYEVGDEYFRLMTKQEYLRALRRAYREFSTITKALRNKISYIADGTNKAFKLYGTGSDSRVFGDNVLGFWRVEYKTPNSEKGLKAIEVDFDAKNALELESLEPPADTDIDRAVYYAIVRMQQDLWQCWAHLPTAGDIVTIYYYEIPKIDEPADYDTEIMFDRAWHDYLVPGVVAFALRRLYRKALINKDTKMASMYKEDYAESREEWEAVKYKVSQEVLKFMDDTIPIVQEIGSPFADDSNDDSETEIVQDV